MNPYDTCTVNKVTNGAQRTLVWHVDDLNISHKDPKEVTSIIDLLDGEFGKEVPVTQTRGKIHDYVGMAIDYSINGKAVFSLLD